MSFKVGDKVEAFGSSGEVGEVNNDHAFPVVVYFTFGRRVAQMVCK